MPNELNYTIDFLSYEWIRNNLVAFIIIFSLIYIAKKNTRNYKFSLLFPYFIGSFLLFRVFAIQWYHYKIGIWDITISLPFHLCSYSSILSGVTLLIVNNKTINFKLKQLLFNFMFFWGLAGFYAFLTPQYTAGIQGYLYYDYYVSHGGFIFAIIYLIIIHDYKPSFNSYYYIFMYSQAVLVVVHIINYMIGPPSNYMYTMFTPVANNPFVIGEPPLHIILINIFAFIHFYFFYKIFYKIYNYRNNVTSVNK